MFRFFISGFLGLCLAVFGHEGFQDHFWPFIGVLRAIWPGVTRKIGKTVDETDVTGQFLPGG